MAAFKEIDHGWDRIKNDLRLLNDSHTKVGVQQGETHKGEDGELSDMVIIAAANEFGTRRIPPRPFMKNAFDGNQQQIRMLTTKMYSDVVRNMKSVKDALGTIGEFFTAKVKTEIRNLKVPPNAPSTIRRKKSSNPLIDTAQMVQTISHVEVIR